MENEGADQWFTPHTAVAKTNSHLLFQQTTIWGTALNLNIKNSGKCYTFGKWRHSYSRTQKAVALAGVVQLCSADQSTMRGLAGMYCTGPAGRLSRTRRSRACMCAMICSVLSNLRLGPSRARARAPGGRRIRLRQYSMGMCRCHEIDHPPMPDHPPFANCAK